MWWLAIGGVVALMGIASSGEKKAAKKWNRKQYEVKRSIRNQRENISGHMRRSNSNYQFRKLCDLHFESATIGRIAYSTYKDAKLSYRGVSRMLHHAFSERTKVRAEIKKAEKERRMEIIVSLGEQHKIVQQMIKEISKERAELFKQKEEFYNEMTGLNARTKDLKYMIRSNCGGEGAAWYQRLKERSSNRKRIENR